MALRKVQEDVKRQADGEQQKVENWKKDNKVILSIKDLVFKERPVKKLMERYIKLYEIKEVVSRNIVKLKLPAPIRVYLVVNISRIEKYRGLVREQKIEELKLVEVKKVKK